MGSGEALVALLPLPSKADLRLESLAIKQNREKSRLMKRAQRILNGSFSEYLSLIPIITSIEQVQAVPDINGQCNKQL